MLESFKASLGKLGMSNPSLFIVDFPQIPSTMLRYDGIQEMQRSLSMLAEQAEFAGTQVLTQDHRHYDLSAKFAYAKSHDDLNIQFRLDRAHLVKRFFELWIDSIYDRRTGNMRYKADYTGTIQIHQLMENGASSYAIEYQEAFPVTLGQVSLGWDQAGQYAKLPVTFSFRHTRPIPPRVFFQGTPPTQSLGSLKGSSEMPSINNLEFLRQHQSETSNRLTSLLNHF